MAIASQHIKSKAFCLALVTSNLLIPAALLVFAWGFFPYKAFLPGSASYTHDQMGLAQNAPFDKVIFMVVDALRSDFVFSPQSGFQFTQELIRSGFAIPFTAHAAAPTITMPRIKAITTGSIPSFLDVILNFAESDKASNLEGHDTWLGQLKAKRNGHLVLLGDDTWLKLFPQTFAYADGTSSFFVSDYTEVDYNVTRNIPALLERDEWDGMVLHYLGLDHIGHKMGPSSPYMLPKQAEMDGIVADLYRALQNTKHLESTLLVLCGDHGMNDAGNHGGSSRGETSTALVFISPRLGSKFEGSKCPTTPLDGSLIYYDRVEQSDIVPTLAGLLGFPIPQNNLGVFISRFLPFWNPEDRIHILQHNAKQILKVVKGTFPNLSFGGQNRSDACEDVPSAGTRLACLWSRLESRDDTTTIGDIKVAALYTFLKDAQDFMSTTATDYSMSKLYFGILLGTLAALPAWLIALPLLQRAKLVGSWFSLLTLTYGVLMFASSYVEEEQQCWYLMASTWLFWLVVKVCRLYDGVWSVLSVLTPFMALRLIRAWNQTGQKHASRPDIARGIFPAHTYLLWSVVLIAYTVALTRLLSWRGSQLPLPLYRFLAVVICTMCLVFKVSFTLADAPELFEGFRSLQISVLRHLDLVLQARMVFIGLALSCFDVVLAYPITGKPNAKNPQSQKRLEADMKNTLGRLVPLQGILTLFLMTESRVTNVPLFALFELQLQGLARMNLSLSETNLTSIIFQYMSFFAFGGSNAISTIDLSNAYNGVAGYNVLVVGALTFCSNWAGPIWWTLATASLLVRGRQGKSRCSENFYVLSTIFVANATLFVMLACTALRTHLFVWTVFSPKFLYMIAWVIGQHLCVNTAFLVCSLWVENKDSHSKSARYDHVHRT